VAEYILLIGYYRGHMQSSSQLRGLGLVTKVKYRLP